VWFLESPNDLNTVHSDHEPADRAAASWTAPVLWRFDDGRGICDWRNWVCGLVTLLGKGGRGLPQSKALRDCRGGRKIRQVLDQSSGALQNLAGIPAVHGEPPFVFRMHGDHEPRCSAGSAGILPASRRFRVEGQNRPAGRRRSQARSMEGPLDSEANRKLIGSTRRDGLFS
jgi:hypothetical protein